jgi:gliding motility-associated-like protein
MKKFCSMSVALLCSLLTTAQTASFTFSSPSGNVLCAPAVVNFVQTCTGNPIGFTWSFGNGQVSNEPNPTVSFNTGNYQIKLVAIFETGPLEAIQNISVNNSITASLSADKNYICLPGTINFTASTNSANATYQYSFGDGNNSTNGNSTQHNYTNFGNYTTSILVTDANGCTATASTTIEVKQPPISASITPITGCAQLLTNATANVQLPVGSSVTNYTWSFGDGSTAQTTTGSIPHTYADSGRYISTVSITTTEGCSNTATVGTVNVGIPPINAVAYASKLQYCGNETSVFVAKATFANSYLWNFGDGTTATTADTTITHKYATLGIKNITVTPLFNGCAGVQQNLQIEIIGVIASFTFSNTCTNKKTFAFTNTSQGNISTSTWAFGDNTPNATTLNTTHTYPAQGAFTTTLTVVDNITACTDAASVTIYTANPTLTNPDNFVCRNSQTTFTINNSYSNGNVAYTYNTLGASTAGANPYVQTASTFGNFGTHTVLINNGTGYCVDTISLTKNISVRGPQLAFTIPDTVCANNNFIVTNSSTPYLAADAINNWQWFANATKIDSVFAPSTKRLAGAGVYAIKLKATDINNCTDSLSKNLFVKQSPFLRIFPRFDTLCQGQTKTIIAYHSDSLSWQPATSVSCSTCDTTTATPTASGLVFAIAQNNLGCSVTDSVQFLVQQPFTASAVNSPLYICKNDTATLRVNPPNKIITWQPIDGLSNANNYNPIVTAMQTQTYTAIITDSLGCFADTVAIQVNVKTLPIVNAGPDRVLPYQANYTMAATYSNNITSYAWSPATNLSCTACANPSGVAEKSQQYRITVTSDSGCVAQDDINIFIECNKANIFIPTAFSPDGDSKNDKFWAFTRGIKKVVRFSIFNRMGQLIYDLQNALPNEQAKGWDGNFKGFPQPQAAYVYVMQAECDQGSSIILKNSFMLIR